MKEDFERMTPELKAYLDFDPKSESGGYEKKRVLKTLIDPSILKDYIKFEKDKMFEPSKEDISSREDHESSSGKYKLVTSTYQTSPGHWSYSQGRVYKNESDEPIGIINRNYSAFPFQFVENHPNGHDYLICGEDYQGQTVIELDTGKRVDSLSEGAEEGAGFCWSDYEFHAGAQILTVCGCHWACPYEYRFYDFSDPMSGWPQLETDEYIDADSHKPTIEADGTIKTYQTEASDQDDETSIASTMTFRREGNKLVLLLEDVTTKEKERRREKEENNKAYEKWLAEFKSTDPLYLRSIELAKDPVFSPEEYVGIGQTYEEWCPHWTGEERRICRSIVNEHSGNYSIRLEFAHLTGPIRMAVYMKGSGVDSKWFEHSIDGMEKAFEYAKGVVSQLKL
jgi:hypothetical protein